jgi:hypothetical protein
MNYSKRKNRTLPTKLKAGYFPLDIHKSMFINDLMITIPAYYVKSWGKRVLSKHNSLNNKWDIDIIYKRTKDRYRKSKNFKAKLTLSKSKGRKQESNYRIKWGTDFAIQLAKDYPNSFVRSLEFHIGDELYKKKGFSEFDIGGFKEQLQIEIKWNRNKPIVHIRELFKVREETQDYPTVYKELSSYLIADHLLGTEDENLRRIQVDKWKTRPNISRELKENIIYILLNRNKKMIYIGETKLSLSKRYPNSHRHHTFDDYDEYTIINLPPDTLNHSRLLIERVLLAAFSKFFINKLYSETPLLDPKSNFALTNKKK